MYPEVSERAAVYAPVGAEVIDYLNRISSFNARQDNPTRWELDLHLSADFLREMLRDRPGNIAVFAGRNRGKIDRIVAALQAGLHVLADKPWIIDSAGLPKLEQALEIADRNGVAAYDIMTERYEATSELQRAFVNDPEVFGRVESVRARSVHHVMKMVAGAPLRRPAWFFEIEAYGEGLADVGTHVVDLVQWTAFADQAIDWRTDIQILGGDRWPLTLTKEQLRQVTGTEFPGTLDYYCNNSVKYTLRGLPVELEIVWHWEAPPGGGDVYEAAFRGTRSHVEIRQGESERWIPELYVVPVSDALLPDVFEAARRRVAALQAEWPGVEAVETSREMRIAIPERYRVGHEQHFAQVTNRFFDYVRDPRSMPAWERPNMLAKYYVSTHGTEVSTH